MLKQRIRTSRWCNKNRFRYEPWWESSSGLFLVQNEIKITLLQIWIITENYARSSTIRHTETARTTLVKSDSKRSLTVPRLETANDKSVILSSGQTRQCMVQHYRPSRCGVRYRSWWCKYQSSLPKLPNFLRVLQSAFLSGPIFYVNFLEPACTDTTSKATRSTRILLFLLMVSHWFLTKMFSTPIMLYHAILLRRLPSLQQGPLVPERLQSSDDSRGM